MKTKALRKEFYMEIKKTYNRFLSIFLIVALGVAFFSGIRAAKPDMELSADKFYDENNYMDIRVLSTLGLTKEDAKALEKVEGIETVMPSYSFDVLNFQEAGMYTLKVFSMPLELNQITPIEGRLPEKSGECILDSGLKELGYQIGDVITIESGTEDDISDSFHVTEYTVVGMGITPAYLSIQRESSRIGRGYVDGFMAILEEDFSLEAYTEIYLSVDGAKNLVSYREDYENLVDGVVENIEVIQPEREEARYLEVKAEADEKIADAEKELADGKKEAEQELSDAYKKITDAKKDIADGKKEIEDGKRELSDGKRELSDAQKEINDGEKKLADGKKEYEKGKKELEASKTELNAKKTELLAGKKELEAQRKNLEEQKAGLLQQEAQFLQAKEAGFLDAATIAATEQQLTLGKQQLEAGDIELTKAEKELAIGEKQLMAGEKQLATAEKELAKAKKTLETSEQELVNGQKEIDKGWKDIAKAEQELKEGEQELLEGEQELIENEATYWEEKAKADREIADAEKELSDAKKELADLEVPEWYVLGREYSQVYAEFGQNAERIGAIGEVFPVFFFLIAALVCLTTMTRMVEEERTQIGTLKALGYSRSSIAAKYLLYAGLASFGGGVFGALIGQKALPLVIVNAYRMMYVNLPYCLLPYNAWYSITSIGVVMGCTVLAAYFACVKELRSNAAELMRPEAPKAGKRVLLERISFIWKRLSFGQKSSVRNLFRYKKRFFMTIIGIGGCMALLLVGYGVKDSIFNIAKFQYEELFIYNGAIVEKEDASEEERTELLNYLDNNKNVEGWLPVYQTSVDLTVGGTEKNAYLICPEKTEGFEQYITLRDRLSKEEYHLAEDMEGIVLTEKMASMLKVEVGDSVTIKLDDTTRAEAKILHIVENYAMHYVYLTTGLYEQLFGEQPEFNLFYYKVKDDSEASRDAFTEAVLDFEAASEVQSNATAKKSIEDMLGSMNIVVYVLIISAGLLAFVVLYNLNNININERRRELATLRVLGFYNHEVGTYVYRESVMLTAIGIVVGAILGMVLHRYVILTAEVDMLMFGRNINAISFVYSAVLTAMFSTLINWIMYYKLKKIDMVESLKSIE